MDFTCPACEQPVAMQPQGHGMYGSKPTFVFAEHTRADAQPCPASLLTDADARELAEK
jgi:hypothetical protein